MLYLVQHGEALSKEQDPDRPLSPRGESDITRIAGFLAASGISVDRVIHSGKTRARQTATILAGTLSATGAVETQDGISPNDSVEMFADVLTAWSTPTMVVGHLPFMAKLVTYLLTQNSEPSIVTYQPGSVVYMSQDEQNRWTLNWMVRPELLLD
ncbi:MAG: phosphohistidine phosphatase SixA [Gammaproteobacteria bacterium]|jgi:phosphohistidine phosphatase